MFFLHFFAGDFHMLIPVDPVDKYFFTNFTFELVVNNCPVSHQIMAQNFMSRLWIEITFLALINDFFILWRRIFIFVIFMRIGQAITKQLKLCQFCWKLKKLFRYFIFFSFSGWQSSSLAEGFSWAISLNAFFTLSILLIHDIICWIFLSSQNYFVYWFFQDCQFFFSWITSSSRSSLTALFKSCIW